MTILTEPQQASSNTGMMGTMEGKTRMGTRVRITIHRLRMARLSDRLRKVAEIFDISFSTAKGPEAAQLY